MNRDSLNVTMTTRISLNFRDELVRLGEKNGESPSSMFRILAGLGYDIIIDQDLDKSKTMVITNLDKIEFRESKKEDQK